MVIVCVTEEQKVVACQYQGSQSPCQQCCRDTAWPYPAQEVGCLAICYSPPCVGRHDKTSRAVLNALEFGQ
ncbi:hypothetical protein ACOMHN_007922 [Nucella lapillus]